MEDAHVDAVMILGQVFSEKIEAYDFGGQNVTKRSEKKFSQEIYNYKYAVNNCLFFLSFLTTVFKRWCQR